MSDTQAENIVCLILCAGKGTRMRPLTYTRPKQLLPIGNRVVIDHILAGVKRTGIRDVCLVVDPDAKALRAHVKAHRPAGLRFRFVVQPKPDGIADAVERAKRVVGERAFIVCLGDAFYGDQMVDFVDRFVREYPRSLVRLHALPDPRQYGVAKLAEDSRIIKVREKPERPPTNLAITGLYGFPHWFYRAIEATEPDKTGERQITSAIAAFLSSEHGVYGEEYEGLWADAGRPSMVLEANAAVLNGLNGRVCFSAQIVGAEPPPGVAVGARSRVEKCRFRGPVLIGRKCVLVNATIKGPCSINDGAVITNSTICTSIVDRDAHIEKMGAGLIDSIIGIGAEVKGGGKGSGVRSVVVGDYARLRFD